MADCGRQEPPKQTILLHSSPSPHSTLSPAGCCVHLPPVQTPRLHGSDGHDGDGPNTSKQVPGSGPTLQVRHWPHDCTTQQTPSVQNPESHSVPFAQALPSGFDRAVVVDVVVVEVVVVGAAQPPDGPRT